VLFLHKKVFPNFLICIPASLVGSVFLFLLLLDELELIRFSSSIFRPSFSSQWTPCRLACYLFSPTKTGLNVRKPLPSEIDLSPTTIVRPYRQRQDDAKIVSFCLFLCAVIGGQDTAKHSQVSSFFPFSCGVTDPAKTRPRMFLVTLFL